MKILALCYPMYNGQIHTCGANKNYVVLAPHDILGEMSRSGISIELVSLYQPVKLTLPDGMKLKDISEVTSDVDAYIHMFRDPTEPEVLDILQTWDMPSRLTLNDAFKLRDLSKWKYVPLLWKHGIGSEIAEPSQIRQWGPQTFSTRISADQQWIETAAFNNNRGQYLERRDRERIVTRFINNATKGVRSFFRIGYVLGCFATGWMYLTLEEQRIMKTGTAAHSVPFDLPRRYQNSLRSVLEELSIDYCHIEGCFIGDKLYVFDINAHPTASGSTLSHITKDMASLMIERLKMLLHK